MRSRIVFIAIAICVASLFGFGVLGQPGASDRVIKRDGHRVLGHLGSFDGTSAVINGQSIPRDQIVWIGISAVVGLPPPVKNPATDEVHARGGAVESGRLVSISASKVVTEKRSYDRAQVAWIHLALPPGGAASRPGREIPAPEKPGPETETPGPGAAVFHYDVEVIGHERSVKTETGSPNPDWNGTTRVTVEWTTTFKNVVLHKLGKPGADWFVVESGVPDAHDIHGGATDVKYTYEETRRGVGACRKTILLSKLESYLLLRGSRNVLTDNGEFGFHSGLDHSAGDLSTTIENMTKDPDGCIKLIDSWPTWDDDLILAVVRGLTIRRSYGDIYVIAERRDPRGGPLLSPLKELAVGDSFSFTTGEVQRSFSGGGEHTKITAMTEIKVNVTGQSPVPKPPPTPPSDKPCPSTLEADSRLEMNPKNPDLQYAAWAACVERARCKKTPESACANKKPPGNWPDVP